MPGVESLVDSKNKPCSCPHRAECVSWVRPSETWGTQSEAENRVEEDSLRDCMTVPLTRGGQIRLMKKLLDNVASPDDCNLEA